MITIQMDLIGQDIFKFLNFKFFFLIELFIFNLNSLSNHLFKVIISIAK